MTQPCDVREAPGGVNEHIAGEPPFAGDENLSVGFPLPLQTLERGVGQNLCTCSNGLIGEVTVELQTMTCKGIQFELVGFPRWKEHAHVVKTVQAKPLWKIEIGYQPLMVVNMAEGSYDFSPIWNALAALGRIADHRSSFKDKNIDALFGQTLGGSTSCRTGSDHDDRAMLNVLHGQTIASSVPDFDKFCDVQHHGFRFGVREDLQGGLRPFEVGSNQQLGIHHAVGSVKQRHQLVKIIVGEGLDEF